MNEWYHKVDNKTLVTTENNIQDIKNKINKMSQELSGLQQERRTFKSFRMVLINDKLNYSLNQFFCALFFVSANIIVPAISKVIKSSI